MANTKCEAVKKDGTPCGMRPLLDQPYCFSHHPDHKEEAAEARRRGGERKLQEIVTARSYNVSAFESAEDIRRVIVIGIMDTLELPNSLERARALYMGCAALTKLWAGTYD